MENTLIEYSVVLYTRGQEQARWKDRPKFVRMQRLILNAQWNASRNLPELNFRTPIDVRLTRIASKEMSDDDLRYSFAVTFDELCKLMHLDPGDSGIHVTYGQIKGKEQENRVRIDITTTQP